MRSWRVPSINIFKKETLGNICRTAKVFTNADWVIILPLLEGDPHRLDVKNMGFAGALNNPLSQVIEETSHFGGISRHVLKKNTLVIRDIDDRKNPVNRQLNISDHHFIKSEGVKALIGAAIHSKEVMKSRLDCSTSTTVSHRSFQIWNSNRRSPLLAWQELPYQTHEANASRSLSPRKSLKQWDWVLISKRRWS